MNYRFLCLIWRRLHGDRADGSNGSNRSAD